MKNIISVLIVGLILVVFQNCGRHDSSSETISSSDITATNLVVKDLSSHDFSEVSYLTNGYWYKVDLNTNKLNVVGASDFGTAGAAVAEYCLNDTTKSQVVNLLASLQICHTPAKSGMMCAMIYVYPYAQIVSGGTSFTLGEKTSSCSETTDFCQDGASQFKNLFNQIVSNLSTLSCSH